MGCIHIFKQLYILLKNNFFFKALRVSMEEQRQRQEGSSTGGANTGMELSESKAEGEMGELERALAMSLDQGSSTPGASAAGFIPPKDIASMTEEEQIAYAMQMSMQDTQRKFISKSFIIVFFSFTLSLLASDRDTSNGKYSG